MKCPKCKGEMFIRSGETVQDTNELDVMADYQIVYHYCPNPKCPSYKADQQSRRLLVQP